MDDLFPTGMSAPGHPITFEYLGESEEQKCIMRCGCGWSSEVEPSILPWTVNETQAKFQQHIEDEALQGAAITRSFRDENGDSYTLKLSGEQVKLDCYLMGSILGGTGTECVHTINGPNVLEFFAEARAKDSKDLDEKVAEYVSKDWREMHDLVSKHQTDVSIWEETDWSDSIDLKVAIVGEAKVGNLLTSAASALSPKGQYPITYQWCSSESLDGQFKPIESAINDSYLLLERDRGAYIKIDARARDEIGFNSSSRRSEPVGPVA